MRENPIIVALDVETAEQARNLVRKLGDSVNFYKVGMELYASAGPEFVRELVADGRQVFLDLKFYDIPETVRRAVVQVARLGVRFLTVHAVDSVMRAAAAGRDQSSLQLLAVTVLTSFGEVDLAEMGYSGSIADLVARRSRNAMACNMNGIVCSPMEVEAVRRITGPGAVLVTPGVRSAGADAGDQRRVATPLEAVRSGANYLVIGREVTRSADPRAQVQKILSETGVSAQRGSA
jgi:orotidine-5'-phosphate decarboxylase